MNFLFIAGHLGSDPDIRFTANGQKVTTLRVACNTRKSGKDETMWWRVTVWGDQFDKMVSYLKKGSPVMVYGEMQKPEMYSAKDGSQQISLNMTATQLMFNPFGRSQVGATVGSETANEEVVVHQGSHNSPVNNTEDDEDLPF